MIIRIPCSKKVYNIWATVVIIACFCTNFPGPIIGLAFLLYLFLKNYTNKMKTKQKIQQFEKTGIYPEETIYSIGLALFGKLKKLKPDELKIFKSTYDFLLIDLEENFPFVLDKNYKNTIPLEQIKLAIKYIEGKISFIKQNMPQETSEIFEYQLDIYFIFLTYCYACIYNDVRLLVTDINKILL